MKGSSPFGLVSAELLGLLALGLCAEMARRFLPPTAGHVPRSGKRLVVIDGMRGAAVCFLVVYHFTWDLGFFGVMVWAEKLPPPSITHAAEFFTHLLLSVIGWFALTRLGRPVYAGAFFLLCTWYCIAAWTWWSIRLGVCWLCWCSGAGAAASAAADRQAMEQKDAKGRADGAQQPAATASLPAAPASTVCPQPRCGGSWDARRWAQWPALRRAGRLAALAACANLATWYFTSPHAMIRFGTLHMFAVNSVLVLPFLGAPRVAAAVAMTMQGLDVLNLLPEPERALGPRHMPVTSLDYQPALRNFPYMLWGVVVHDFGVMPTAALIQKLSKYPMQAMQDHLFVRLGRRSLTIYLGHQAVMVPLAFLCVRLAEPLDVFLSSVRS